MAGEKNYIFPMIAIVAIVAIVGLVMMFLQNKGGATYIGTTPKYAATTEPEAQQAMPSEQITVTKEGGITKVVAEGILEESNSIGQALSRSTCCTYEDRFFQYCSDGCRPGMLGYAYYIAWSSNCATKSADGGLEGRYSC